MCSQQSKGAKYPQKSFNCADAFSIKITRFHAALKPIFRSLKPFQAFSSLLNLGARDFSFYMNTHTLPFSIVCAPERQSVPGRSAFLFVLWRRPASFRRWPVLRPYRPRAKPPLLGVGLTSCKTVCKNLPLYSLKQRHQSWHTCSYISTYCLALALQLKSHSMARFTSCCQPSGYSYPAFARNTAFSMSWAL